MQTMNELEILKKENSIHVMKDNGTEVNYFIFPEAEIHLNAIAPHTVQEWHFHKQIDENLVITKGTLLCRWLDDGKEMSAYAKRGDVIRVHDSVHTFENDTDDTAEFIVFRYVPEGEDRRELIKHDKTVVER